MPSPSSGSTDQLSAAEGAGEDSQKRSIYWKTRICAKWRDNNCQFGDKCRYAHGEHELRILPPELVEQLEADKQWKEGLGDELAPEEQFRHLRELLRKTRMCDKFVDNGSCPYGPNCNFAHGQHELRQAPNGALERFRNLQQLMNQNGIDPLKPGTGLMQLLKSSKVPTPAASGKSEGLSKESSIDDKTVTSMPGDEVQPDAELDGSTDTAVLQSRITDLWRVVHSLRDHAKDLQGKRKTLHAEVSTFYTSATSSLAQLTSQLEDLGKVVNTNNSVGSRAKRRTTDA